LDAVFNHWAGHGVKVNPGASASQLGALTSFMGHPLPDDVTSFYLRANGMVDYEQDDHMVSFWSIERILADQDDSTDRRIIFGDYMISSWYFVYRPSAAGFTVALEIDDEVAFPSFGDFLRVYAFHADSLPIL
jgi:hypothetical protein